MIRSLLFVLVLASSLAYAPAWSQQSAKIPLVAILVTHAATDDPIFDKFREGLRELGYEEGRNIKLELVTALGNLDKLPALAQDLIRRNPDVIIAPNELSTRTAKEATTSIPIVMVGVSGYDPVEMGFVKSYARPGGNITGLYGFQTELETKRLELVKEIFPKISRVVVLYEPAFGRVALPEMHKWAKPLGLHLDAMEVKTSADLDAAFNAAKRKKARAVMLMNSPIFYVNRAQVAALGVRTKLPVIAPFNLLVKAGALASHGPDAIAAWKRTAYYVDRILKGTKPADLPVEQAYRFTLSVNLKTANALGIDIPMSILLRADEVIQ